MESGETIGMVSNIDVAAIQYSPDKTRSYEDHYEKMKIWPQRYATTSG